MYVQHMPGLLRSRRLNAREFCTSMWLTAKAGVREAQRYGLRPDAPNGHYQRHLDPLAQHKAYNVAVHDIEAPTHGESDLSRAHRVAPVAPPHEALAKEADVAARASSVTGCAAGRALAAALLLGPSPGH